MRIFRDSSRHWTTNGTCTARSAAGYAISRWTGIICANRRRRCCAPRSRPLRSSRWMRCFMVEPTAHASIRCMPSTSPIPRSCIRSCAPLPPTLVFPGCTWGPLRNGSIRTNRRRLRRSRSCFPTARSYCRSVAPTIRWWAGRKISTWPSSTPCPHSAWRLITYAPWRSSGPAT